MQTLEKDLDSYDTTICTDGSAIQTAVAASLSPLATQVTLESTVSAPSRPTNDARLSKQKRMRYEWAMNSNRRMSSSIIVDCATFNLTKGCSSCRVSSVAVEVTCSKAIFHLCFAILLLE